MINKVYCSECYYCTFKWSHHNFMCDTGKLIKETSQETYMYPETTTCSKDLCTCSEKNKNNDCKNFESKDIVVAFKRLIRWIKSW